jgi:hypothetical protein
MIAASSSYGLVVDNVIYIKGNKREMRKMMKLFGGFIAFTARAVGTQWWSAAN